jgi:lysozyme
MKNHVLLYIVLVLCLLGCEKTKKEEVQKEAEAVESEAVPTEVEKKKTPSFVYGIDISMFQSNEINTLTKQEGGLQFIICKATEGVTYTDPKFLYNWKTIKEKSFVRGAYHFYRSEDNPLHQAASFLNAIATIDPTDLPPIIDFEEAGIDASQSVSEIQSNLKVFINEIEKKLKRTPIIYTDVIIGNKYLNDASFAKYSLWIASYDGKETPDIPNTWKEKGWTVWQKSDRYKIDGTTDDFDVFNGSLQELKRFIKNSHR